MSDISKLSAFISTRDAIALFGLTEYQIRLARSEGMLDQSFMVGNTWAHSRPQIMAVVERVRAEHEEQMRRLAVALSRADNGQEIDGEATGASQMRELAKINAFRVARGKPPRTIDEMRLSRGGQ